MEQTWPPEDILAPAWKISLVNRHLGTLAHEHEQRNGRSFCYDVGGKDQTDKTQAYTALLSAKPKRP